MMFYALWLLAFLYLVPLECKSEGYPPASNCTSVECPPYSVVHSEKDFEIRIYQQANWVSGPDILDTSFETAFPNAISGLDAYYGGENVGKLKIDKTAPVFVDVKPALYYVQNTTFRANYYLPKKYQNGGAPKPLSPGTNQQVKFPKRKYAAVGRFALYFVDDALFLAFDPFLSALKGTPYQRAASFNEFTIAFYKKDVNSAAEGREGFNEVLVWFD